MKLSKTDMYNLSCLELFKMGVWDETRCLESIKWGSRTTVPFRDGYIKKLIRISVAMEETHPGMIKESFKKNIQPTLDELQEVHRGREQRNKEANSKEESNQED